MTCHSHTPGRRALGALAICLFLVMLTTPSQAVNWRYYDNECPPRNGPDEFLCGDYGRFYINGQSALPGCALVAQGSDESAPYQVVRNVQHFPAVELPVGTAGRAASVVTDPSEVMLPATQLHSGQPLPWLVVIDFDGGHGTSVHWLARSIAGEQVANSQLLLDAPTVSSSGAVTDIDVLKQLCVVANRANDQHRLRPIVNMSFGRALESGDPVGGAACSSDLLACQIRRVTEHLTADGAVLVAAAGKQKSWMFPAALETVIGAALIDPSGFSQSAITVPTWDMPGGPQALMPGNSLCLRGGWPAPSGASYSSAILSGWLSFAMTSGARLPAGDLGTLVPVYSEMLNCHVLGNTEGIEYTQCNDNVDALFAGLDGQFDSFCWHNPDEALDVTARLGSPDLSPPESVGVVEWNSEVRPAPEGDPCVPCTGGSFLRGAAAADFQVNLSNTLPVRDELVLESLHLRADDKFFEIVLDDSQLEAFRQGLVASLTIEGGAMVTSHAQSMSLFFRFRDTAALHCADQVNGQPACGWMATHIHQLR